MPYIGVLQLHTVVSNWRHANLASMQEEPTNTQPSEIETPSTDPSGATAGDAAASGLSLTPEEARQLTESLDPAILALLALC